jgi:hypothetical protein
MPNLNFGLIAATAIATLAGCASRGDGWPSLMTPEEQRTGKPATTSTTPELAVAAPAAPTPASLPAVDTGSTALIRAQISRLAEASRDARYIQERFGKQRDILSDAISKVGAKGPADSQWNVAQMELTKLNQIIAEWDDLEALANAVAGQLAVGAHQGAVVAAPLADAGALLAQITQSRREASTLRDVMRRKISQ